VCRFLAPFAPGNPQIWASQTGQSKPGLKLKDLEEFVVVLPPTLAEQQAIAGALSDADAWIESLEQLIAKKRQIKQGAMQELLTGKRRLPGFSGKWETKRLEEIGSTYSGLTGKTKSDFGNGDAHYVTFMNVMSNVVIDCATFERVNVVASESQNLVRKNDILFNGSSETPEEVAMCAFVEADVSNVYLNSFCFGFRFHEDLSIHGRFLAYYLRSNVGREMMKSLAQGSTRYNLSKTALLKAVLALPSPAEQAAIATVLSDMDTEIESLESKLAKAREIKQGMMQELLTGKIRLIEN
jgi:type I restriction enzyme S subunit